MGHHSTLSFLIVTIVNVIIIITIIIESSHLVDLTIVILESW